MNVKIENYYGTYAQAVNYYYSLYLIGNLKVEISTNLKANQMLKLKTI
ncbi:MAG: hypothetical protein PHC46_04250 [Clostridia bacterium]|nr:hypothetical protein [Clostridia bacterium]